ncbi:leucyl/phenylalanyl-tRNA--protein transferase [Psychrobacter raelei]|uniref:Leucyl/phenylalanyl-tRNA--protein transferase n=1 Tax=Psychrobacter raelei TaxID=2565531 RepID=A0AAU6PVT7_9GAMM
MDAFVTTDDPNYTQAPGHTATDNVAQAPLFDSPYLFPNPSEVDPEGLGLVGMGGDLAPQTLLSAYAQGLFPWFNEDEPIAWWCPEPRCVLAPDSFVPSKSLQRLAKNSQWQWSVNSDFESVIHACSLPRSYAKDTWIHDEMIEAYCQLHQLGYAHSIEVWEDKQLIGGLYGLKIGQIYFGESMFHHKSNASKVAFWALTQFCQYTQVQLIDCQLPNPHLQSLGAAIMPREDFLTVLSELTHKAGVNWHDFSLTRYAVNALLQRFQPQPQ